MSCTQVSEAHRALKALLTARVTHMEPLNDRKNMGWIYRIGQYMAWSTLKFIDSKEHNECPELMAARSL